MSQVSRLSRISSTLTVLHRVQVLSSHSLLYSAGGPGVLYMRRSQPLVLALLSISMLGPRVVNKLDFVIKNLKIQQLLAHFINAILTIPENTNAQL